MTDNPKEKLAGLEALLFIYGEPMDLKDVAKRLKLSMEDCKNLIDEYDRRLKENPERGLTLVQNADKIQLATKPALQNLVQEFIREEFREKLTPAAVEVLAIVAYLGPLPRSVIDQIRGVNSSFILRALLVRGLIERNVEPHRSHVYLYDVSHETLKHLGLTDKKELPEFNNYKDILNKFQIEQTNE